ncbi:terminal uridylyltransferase 4, partial [Aplysia californica]|uniref:Terminal uridylyltransferase 4 n=1 Tax=Aplysia californica TaxID=6500 RepID=A0ABM0ZZG7_APLCA
MAEGFDKNKATNDLKHLLNLNDSAQPLPLAEDPNCKEPLVNPKTNWEKKKKKKKSKGGSDSGNQKSENHERNSPSVVPTNSNGNAVTGPVIASAETDRPPPDKKGKEMQSHEQDGSAPDGQVNSDMLLSDQRSGGRGSEVTSCAATSSPIAAKKTKESAPKPNKFAVSETLKRFANDCPTDSPTSLQSSGQKVREEIPRSQASSKNGQAKDKEGAASKNGQAKEKEGAASKNGQAKEKESAASKNGQAKEKEGAASKNGQAKDKEGAASDRKVPATNTNNNKPRPAKLGESEMSPEFQNLLELHKMHSLKKKNARFPKAKFFCRLCDYHLDTAEDCEKHMKDNRHCRRKEIGEVDAILRLMPAPSEKQVRAISAAVEGVCERHGIDEWEQNTRRHVVSRLEKLVQEKIPEVLLFMYGSSLTGFGLKDADVNVNLNSSKKDSKLTYLLKDVYCALRDRSDIGFTEIQADFSAKVPALKLTEEVSGLRLTVTIHCYAAHCSSELLAIYSDFDPRVRKLAVVFRYWAHLCGLDRQMDGFIPPQALNLMVVYYLQHMDPQLVPIVQPPKVSGEEVGDFRQDAPTFERMRRKVMKAQVSGGNDM